jgi:hypothetical protein
VPDTTALATADLSYVDGSNGITYAYLHGIHATIGRQLT